MDSLTNLAELDLAQNALPKVPDALYSLRNLRRLNLSHNEITELSQAIGKFHCYRDLLNLLYIFIHRYF
jgi:Leucine-rich repeat (LRR) protein